MATMSTTLVVTVNALLLLVTVSGYDSDWPSSHPEMDTTVESVQQAIVDQHNTIRRNVVPTASNMLKMVWNSDWAESSRKWVNNCSYSHRSKRHLKMKGWECGENIFRSPTPESWQDAVSEWEHESVNPGLEYGVGALGPGMVGHYLQVAWYNSFEVGCAVNYCPTDGQFNYFYQCTYCPGGNLRYRLMKPYNAGAPCAACPGACDDGLCTNPCLESNHYENCDDMKARYGCGNDELGTLVQKACRASCSCQGKIY